MQAEKIEGTCHTCGGVGRVREDGCDDCGGSGMLSGGGLHPKAKALKDQTARAMVKRYLGYAGIDGEFSVVVLHRSARRPLNPRHDLRNHSPDGFAWGYAGSGPAQLALALLADAIDDATALARYQDFKMAVIARLDMRADWELTEHDVRDSVAELLEVARG